MKPPRIVAVALALAALSVPGALLATPPRATRVPSPSPVLPFIADDYTRAVAEARARKVPLFIEAWAPW